MPRKKLSFLDKRYTDLTLKELDEAVSYYVGELRNIYEMTSKISSHAEEALNYTARKNPTPGILPPEQLSNNMTNGQQIANMQSMPLGSYNSTTPPEGTIPTMGFEHTGRMNILEPQHVNQPLIADEAIEEEKANILQDIKSMLSTETLPDTGEEDVSK